MKKLTLLFILLIISSLELAAQQVKFDEVAPFFEKNEDTSIKWGYLTVPENWDAPSDSVKIAVAILKNRAGIKTSEAVVFIQGGPGASGIESIGRWVNHPLRETSDIILFDVRGTGFSEPRLCPDLGKDFFQILAKNQKEDQDEKQKINAALACKEQLIKKGIDLNAYNSVSVSKDLHALNQELNYNQWSVYGVSYGTYMAQVYANAFSEDIKNMILDSSISNIATYYNYNTSNYMQSLDKVFSACENNEECHAEYPNLKEEYYEVIASLNKSPITVKVDKNLIETGTFTFNPEDFKVALQQALYNKQLIEVIPLIIYQFKERNEQALGHLVPAFSSLLQMDYGVYYCFSCNETLPKNNIEEYRKNASQYEKLNGGISFYKSDFLVCSNWNIGNEKENPLKKVDSLSNFSKPVLIFTGEYDPITPMRNGVELSSKFKSATVVNGYTYGHVPSFTDSGKKEVINFLKAPFNYDNKEAFKNVIPLKIVDKVEINPGVSKLGNFLNKRDYLFFSPLIMAFLVMIFFIFSILYNFIKKSYDSTPDKVIRIWMVLMSSIGLLSFVVLVRSIIETSNINYYILAFGLSGQNSFLFTLITVFLAMVILGVGYFIIKMRALENRTILFSALFSNILLVVFYLYLDII